MKQIQLTWYTTASIEIKTDNTTLLFDPFIPIVEETNITKEDYIGKDNILLTHGHIDHISSVPQFANEHTNIYCTKTPKNTLIQKGIDKETIHCIHNYDRLNFKDIQVRVLKGKHIKFDKKIVKETLLNRRILNKQFIDLLQEHKKCKENNEIVCFYLIVDSVSIFIMGSLGLEDGIQYPSNVDYLVLPYQGSSHLLEHAIPVIERLQPKNIILDHFDDSFPPVSKTIDTSGFEQYVDKCCRNIHVIKPKSKESLFLKL